MSSSAPLNTRQPTSRNVKPSKSALFGVKNNTLTHTLFRYETTYEDVCETKYEQQVTKRFFFLWSTRSPIRTINS